VPVPTAIAGLTFAGIVVAIIIANLTAATVEEIPAVVQETGVEGHDVEVTSAGADIHFANTGVDFGVVPLNKEVGYEFSYANVGNETLRIEDVRVRVLEGC
jgi:hypothetical protein